MCAGVSLMKKKQSPYLSVDGVSSTLPQSSTLQSTTSKFQQMYLLPLKCFTVQITLLFVCQVYLHLNISTVHNSPFPSPSLLVHGTPKYFFSLYTTHFSLQWATENILTIIHNFTWRFPVYSSAQQIWSSSLLSISTVRQRKLTSIFWGIFKYPQI